MPAKQRISYADLVDRLEGVLASYPEECRNIHLDAVEVYREQVDGANWHLKGHRQSGDDHDWPECWEKIRADVDALRQRYDVAD